jgi:uncharacterized iron-regulated membrane protein
MNGSSTLFRTLWRWHFYAGLFVLPFIITLSLSGTAFLFKPQIEQWEERAYRALPSQDAVTPGRRVDAALAAFPGAQLHSYRIPAQAGDAVLVHLSLPDGGSMRDVFVSPQGTVIGSLASDNRIVEVARRIHSQLLLGLAGSWLVELAACWAIVMLVTGLFLWWPRGRGAAGVLWPRRRSMLRDLHAVTGFWVSLFALVLLLSGLPWSHVWGSAFRAVRAEMGWVKGAPQWNTGGQDAAAPAPHTDHDHAAMQDSAGSHAAHAAQPDLALLDSIVARAGNESLAYPAIVLVPGAALFGSASADWVATSLTQNRPQGKSITYDRDTGEELSRERFADRHPIDRVIGYGQAWHEGALVGPLNQLVGLLTATALVTMSITAFLMWRRRRPVGALGAPTLPSQRRIPWVITAATLLLALLLPLLAASLLLLWLVDRVLPRVSPRAANWLGIAPVSREPMP